MSTLNLPVRHRLRIVEFIEREIAVREHFGRRQNLPSMKRNLNRFPFSYLQTRRKGVDHFLTRFVRTIALR